MIDSKISYSQNSIDILMQNNDNDGYTYIIQFTM